VIAVALIAVKTAPTRNHIGGVRCRFRFYRAALISVMHSNTQSELILGGQKSGKSARAERLASEWLAQSPEHCAILIATALPSDDEMRARIARHQSDRALTVPQMRVIEESYALGAMLRAVSDSQTLVVIDCLTLWLTNWMMPAQCEEKLNAEVRSAQLDAAINDLLNAIESAQGPVVVVSNEIGLGVIPLGVEVRAYVDVLGNVNQRVAAVCQRVTFMAAGLPLVLKREE
jgi:adenosylcobinamide kinase / adenosylcobinamide-phosphate guanylyltransferase